MKIGFTSTTFRGIKDVDEVIRVGKEAKVDCIEWGGDIHVKDVEKAAYVKKQCLNQGIQISSYGSYYIVGSNDHKDWERISKIANTMGAETVRVWLGKKNSEKFDVSSYENLVNDAKAICKVAKTYGLIVAPECHMKTYNNDTQAFLKIQKDIGCENFKTYFQSLYRKKAYDLDRIEQTIDYIQNFHVSYSEQTREQLLMIDTTFIDTLIDKFKAKNFDGNILLEYTYWGSPKYFVKDIQKLRTKLGE